MVMILGLDISTSCTGWCILDTSGSLVDIGYVNLSKCKSSYEKAKKVSHELSKIHGSHDIQRVVIEENLQAFRPGLSSAKTLLTLARFNGVVSYLAQEEFCSSPEFINVNSARKSVGLKIVSKKKGGKPSKEQVFDWVSSRVSYSWPTKILKSGPRKNQVVLEPGCFDMADAYVISLAGSKMNSVK